MVVDSSAILAVIFNEAKGPRVLDILQANSGQLKMSTVNYAEVLILTLDRQPALFERIRGSLEAAPVRLTPPTVAQAEMAARARIRYPLNLGDCFAYALAKDEECPLLTLDHDFRKTDIRVVLP